MFIVNSVEYGGSLVRMTSKLLTGKQLGFTLAFYKALVILSF